ncbi:methyltransferase [Jiella sp. MQZ9-1]|uniref:Methyltransferase n=1 Tax=Jiella flava TaxID=2816857 RepID=A0A939FZE9_9HYPH|nr:methyltransferase [Jiella flava]MBO0664317.1 methyltransferase [Jiella flava]MCD2472760.1 methyltransferase [Jiella flava]
MSTSSDAPIRPPLEPHRARRFIEENTAITTAPHVPEIRLRLASEAHDIWLKTEEELAELGVPPPFWAFAWAGGQGLARLLLDEANLVAGRTVIDFASGSGLVAIAAAMAGACSVLAADIDPFAGTALDMNLALNLPNSAASVTFTRADLTGESVDAEVLLAGDVFYDRAMAARLVPWFDRLAKRGVTVLVGDPGRAYLPRQHLTALAEYRVPVSRALEDQEIKRVVVWRWHGGE